MFLAAKVHENVTLSKEHCGRLRELPRRRCDLYRRGYEDFKRRPARRMSIFFFNYIFVTRKRALGVGRGALSNTASTQPVFIHCISNIFIIVTLQKPHRLQTY